MEMGYTLDIEYNRLIVQGVLDYDRVVISHRDCLLAEVESQVGKIIKICFISHN
jgi:hypothetical protein